MSDGEALSAVARIVLVFLAFLGGFVAGYLVSVTVSLLLVEWTGVFDREGALSMGIIFTIGPLAGAVSGLAAAVLAARRLRRTPV